MHGNGISPAWGRKRLGINKSRVSEIHKAALEMMAISLQSAGIHLSVTPVV